MLSAGFSETGALEADPETLNATLQLAFAVAAELRTVGAVAHP